MYIFIFIFISIIYFKTKIKRSIFVIKDAHPKTAPDACPETSVRVCFCGKQSIYFSRFRKYFVFWVFV